MMTPHNVRCRGGNRPALHQTGPILVVLLLLAAALLPGCGKPPTFQELMGNKPPEDHKSPAPPTLDPLQPGSQQPAPAAAPAKVDPAAAIAQFKMIQSYEVEDRHLQDLVKLESGHELLDEIKAAGSKLTDTGLQSLSKFTGLKSLDLSGTMYVTDSAMVEIGKTPSLEKLNLNRTRITNAGISEIQDLVNLRELDLGGTAVNDDGFVAFKKLTSLEVIRCSSMPINGKGFDVFHDQGAASSLREIDADHTSFGAFGFQSIKGMNKLEKVDAGQSGVNDNSLRGINTGLRGLKWLELGFNGVSDQGALLLGGLTKLEHLGLRNNPQVSNNAILKAFGTRHKELAHLDLEGTACSAALVAPLKKHNKDLQIVVGGKTH